MGPDPVAGWRAPRTPPTSPALLDCPPGDGAHEERAPRVVEPVAVLLHVSPALAEQIAGADEERVPHPAADGGEDHESAERHALGAGRGRDEGGHRRGAGR